MILGLLLTGCGDDATSPAVPDKVLAEGTWMNNTGSREVGFDGLEVASGMFNPDDFRPREPDHYFFEDYLFQRGDIGDSLTVDSSNCAAWDSLTARLTNGVSNAMILRYRMSPDGSLTSTARGEDSFFEGGLDGSLDPDFVGYQLTRLVYHFEHFRLTSPGSNPNGDGLWTDLEMRIRLCVYGRPE